jgi:hypothetical protein
LRFDTMPSKPIWQAWANMVGPSASMCSFNRRPRAARFNSDARVALAIAEAVEARHALIVAAHRLADLEQVEEILTGKAPF